MSSKNSINIIKYLISGVVILLIVLGLSALVNFGVAAYEKETSAFLNLEAEYSEKKLAIQKELEDAMEDGEDEKAADREKYYAQLRLKEALKKEEAYYEFYTKSNHENTLEGRDYHYYGQFYEMFNSVYDANVIFLGSSRSVYGVNPRILERNKDLDEYSFYNFSLNAAGPSYYLDWYNVFKTEAEYPTPDKVIYCVDWFMFDSNWMWRKMATLDENIDGGALYEIRNYMKGSSGTPLSNTATYTEEEITTLFKDPDDDLPDNEDNKKAPQDLGQYLLALWNGEEKLNFATVAEYLTEKVPLFANQDNIFDMIGYHATGQSSANQIKLKEAREEYEKELEEYREELEEVLADGSNDFPEVEIPDYYSKRSLRIDWDGNVSSKFYKGFIPWEYEHHSAGDGKQYRERSKQEVAAHYKGTDQDEIKNFKKLIRQMQNDGIEVIFVQLPDIKEVRPNDQIAKYTAIISDIAKELGVEFYDYNTDKSEVGNKLAAHQRYYSDWNHFNESGANLFTRYLGEDLVDILKD